MAVEIKRIAPGESIRDFMKVPFVVFQGDPQWIAPVGMLFEDQLNPKKNPFFEHAEAVYFVATKDGKLAGRCTAQIDHEHQKRYGDAVGFFGFFDTIDDPEVARALLDAASAWLKERGMKTIRGPISLSINEEMGCLVNGFDTPPFVMMPHHRAYQAALIEGQGFTKAKDVFAWTYSVGEVPTRARKAHDQLIAEPSLKVREVDMKNAERDMRIVMDIFNDTWSNNWGFVPMTESELRKTVEDFKLILRPEIALVAEIDGEPAAIAIAIPNLNEAARDLGGSFFPFGWAKFLYRLKVSGTKTGRLILLGVRKKYREQKKWMPLSVALYVMMNDRAQKLGMTHGELGWTLEDNAPVNVAIKAMGAKPYKTYRVFEKPL
jgi:hypothetical protein